MAASIGAFTDLNMDTSPTTIYQIDNILHHHQASIDIINTTLSSQVSTLIHQQSDIAELKSTLRQLSQTLAEISSKLSSYPPPPPYVFAAPLQSQPDSPIHPPSPTHFASPLSKIDNPTTHNYGIDISNTSVLSKTAPLPHFTAVAAPLLSSSLHTPSQNITTSPSAADHQPSFLNPLHPNSLTSSTANSPLPTNVTTSPSAVPTTSVPINNTTSTATMSATAPIFPRFFSHLHLSKPSFSTTLETLSPNRCLTVTSTVKFEGRSNPTFIPMMSSDPNYITNSRSDPNPPTTYKTLIFDFLSRDIISSLIHITDRRYLSTTFYVPVDNANRHQLASNISTHFNRSLHMNFISSPKHRLLEKLTSDLARSNLLSRANNNCDHYTVFRDYENECLFFTENEDLFSLVQNDGLFDLAYSISFIIEQTNQKSPSTRSPTDIIFSLFQSILHPHTVQFLKQHSKRQTTSMDRMVIIIIKNRLLCDSQMYIFDPGGRVKVPSKLPLTSSASKSTSALNSCPLLLPTAAIPPGTAPPTATKTTTAAATISAAASLFGNATSTMAAAPPTSTVAVPPLFAAIAGSTIPSFPLDCIRLDSAPSAPAFPISLAAPPVHLPLLSTMASLIPVKHYDSTHQILKSFSDSYGEFLFDIPDTLHTIFQKQQLKVAFNAFDKSKHVDAQIPIGCRASSGQKYRNEVTSPSTKILGMNIIFIFDPGGIFRCRVFFFDLEDKVVFEGMVMIRVSTIDTPAKPKHCTKDLD